MNKANMKNNIIFIIIFAFLFACKSYAGGIAIPGYEKLIFNADEKNQSVKFYNPDSNSCYLRLSLILDGGKELWRSDFIEPGGEVKEILLSETLEAGTYGALLKYECFSLNDKTQLNGLEMKLTAVFKKGS